MADYNREIKIDKELILKSDVLDGADKALKEIIDGLEFEPFTIRFACTTRIIMGLENLFRTSDGSTPDEFDLTTRILNFFADHQITFNGKPVVKQLDANNFFIDDGHEFVVPELRLDDPVHPQFREIVFLSVYCAGQMQKAGQAYMDECKAKKKITTPSVPNTTAI